MTAQQKNRSIKERTVVVILAGGKGTRMKNDDRAKVCFEIDGVPAINRTMATFRKMKFGKFLVVVGDKAQQVMETVSADHPGVMFVCQTPQLGTGHAARFASDALESMGHDDPVLVTTGDKHVEEQAIGLLVEGFIRKQADFALLTIPRTDQPGALVVAEPGGGSACIIERVDLARQAMADELAGILSERANLSAAELWSAISSHISIPKKQATAVPELVELAERGGMVSSDELRKVLALDKYSTRIGDQTYSAREIEENSIGANPSLYLSTATAFYTGVGMLDNDNAQNEYYLTDIVGHLSNYKEADGRLKFRVVPVPADDGDFIQGFNSPDELLAIQDYIRRKKETPALKARQQQPDAWLGAAQYRPVAEWLKLFEKGGGELDDWLARIYGGHPDLHRLKRTDFQRVLECYGNEFGFEEKVVIVRAPGRVNLMGRHVDHRGGRNNFLAIDRETFLVAGRRDDDNVVAVNTEPERFKSQQFNISQLIGRFAWSDWLNFVNSDWVRQLLRSTAGDWVNYIKAAVLRLQHQYQDLKIRGMNIALSGQIPIAAGLSSSSSIVVATLQSAIALNGLELTAEQFVDMCGEGEWFVGSRGGAGDHAAIYLGQRGKIANVGYLPFQVHKMIEAPAEYQVILADSHIKAAKSAAAKDTFNQKICSYNLGLEILKLRCPEIADSVEYLRDVSPDNLGCLTSDVYKWLKKVPQFMTRDDFRSLLPGTFEETMETSFATHREPQRYNVRSVLLFGIAEIVRSRLAVEYLENDGIQVFGELMKISHDGDRVSMPDGNGEYRTHEDTCTDDYLNRLINDLASEVPVKVTAAQLYMQPGGYACSTPEIDRMVDITSAVPGVAGAQIAGAGLGGCIMILAGKESVEQAQQALTAQYYRPADLEPRVIPCTTVEGAGLVEVAG